MFFYIIKKNKVLDNLKPHNNIFNLEYVTMITLVASNTRTHIRI